MSNLCEWHNHNGGKEWRKGSGGIEVKEDGYPRTPGEPISVQNLWEDFGDALKQASWEFEVPVDIVAAMIPVESERKENYHFDPESLRKEPGYVSDQETPHLISPGLMQTLISTAKHTADRHNILHPDRVDRELLFDPFYSIMIGTAYISDLIDRYSADPVLMCAAYNAGGVYRSSNEWGLRVYSPSRIDRYIQWFNDFHAALSAGIIDPPSDIFLTEACEE